MSLSRIGGFKIAGIATSVPPTIAENIDCADKFGAVEVRKVMAMAGVRQRRVAHADVTAADLCFEAAATLIDKLGWAPESITGLIFVTQSPDYFLPSSSCVLHHRLGLGSDCAAFDVGLGCSGYPYGLYLAATMLRAGGHQRILVLHGETPSKFIAPDDHTTTLLFGDAGSATALESSPEAPESIFALHTDGAGSEQLIIRGGGFRDRTPANPRHMHLEMDGAAIFNFTVKRVPALIEETLEFAGLTTADIDSFAFHQSNRFIMLHIAKKCGLPEDRVPLIIEEYGNSGGPSVPLTLTQSIQHSRAARGGSGAPLRVMMLAYGVGLSWGSVLTRIDSDTLIIHNDYAGVPRAA
jgi:3-oxoacyl-[acyl-carrier-protein] synthase III